jgi:hypothetical protein
LRRIGELSAFLVHLCALGVALTGTGRARVGEVGEAPVMRAGIEESRRCGR